MKIWGWILLVFGVLSTFGSLIAGNPLTGGLFFSVLGAYLIHCANKRQEEKKDKDKWINQ